MNRNPPLHLRGSERVFWVYLSSGGILAQGILEMGSPPQPRHAKGQHQCHRWYICLSWGGWAGRGSHCQMAAKAVSKADFTLRVMGGG